MNNENWPNAELAQYIDHTVLHPDTTRETIKKFCDEARKYHFAGCCFNPCHVAFAKKELAGSGVDGVALVSAIFGAQDIEAACRRLKTLSEEMVSR